MAFETSHLSRETPIFTRTTSQSNNSELEGFFREFFNFSKAIKSHNSNFQKVINVQVRHMAIYNLTHTFWGREGNIVE